MSEGSLVRNNSIQRRAPLVVGVGASAGGFEAFRELLTALDRAKDLAIVFVQHQDREDDTLLLELLHKSTPRSVVGISGRMKLKADTIYVCPPWTLLELRNGIVRPTIPESDERPNAPIDYFLQSLAADRGELCVGIILSGNGSDGTIGLKAISDAGGMTIAQSADSAKYGSMPRSAATIGVADHVLTPPEIAEELKRYSRSLAGMAVSSRDRVSDQQIHDTIPAIAKLLVDATNHNFQHYKPNMLARRIRRRMQVLRISKIESYLVFLKENPEEPQTLFRELLISVTAFFRDPEAFDVLSQTVIPELFVNRRPEDVIRIWVPGCATGEEAFTVAILCREAMDRLSSPPEVQIFATDIDERALRTGRVGVYPVGIEEDVSAERLRRFFIKRGKKYQIVKEVRELVLFSVHNLISDPPFSRLDFITCRNLLIYLGSHLQKKLIPLFHYALRPTGFLMLGPSENISSHGDLFRTLDAKHRISQRKETGINATAALPMVDGSLSSPVGGVRHPQHSAADTTEALMQVMQRIVLDEFAPKSVIVEEDGKILCASADMHHYLTVGSGGFQNNVIKMARTGLRIGLRAALQEAKVLRRRVIHDNLSVRINGQLQRVMLTVQPMPKVGENAELFMVVFHDCGLPLVRENSTTQATDGDGSENSGLSSGGADAIIAHLERELASTREDLERSIQEYETTNEELKASNEELRSLNEEMQSANEELETSKEEIQTGIVLLRKAHSDLENLFQSTQIATLFLDANEHLIRFTPAARDLYNLIPTDVGRPLGHITHKLISMPPIPGLAELTLDDNSAEQEVQSLNGRWFLRRVLPYVHEGQADGVIVTFIDISERKRAGIRMATMHRVTRILAADPAMGAIIPDVLQSIRESLSAACCSIWLVDSDANVLKCTESSFDLRQPGLEQFIVESRQEVLKQGSGLPGHVWKTGEPHWIADLAADANFLRRQAASEAGLVSWIGMPVIIGTIMYGVIEIFTQVRLEKDAALLEVLQTVGNEIGQFIARKRLAEKLRDEESRKSAILEAAIDAIVTMDVEGRIVDFNPAAERTFGFTKADVQGRLLSETIVPDEYREAHAGGLARYLKTGIATILGQRLELSAMRKDGSVFPVELAISATATRDGTPFFTAHLRNIAEQKQFIQSIVDRDNRITALLNSTAEGIYGIDLDGRCTFANASCARLLGLESADAVIGRRMHELIHHTRPNTERYPVDECRIYRAFQLGESVHADDELFWRADGTSFNVEYWSFPQIQEGKVNGCVVTFLDISERKRRELALSFLTDLHSSLAMLSSAEAIVGKASQSVAEYLQLSHLMVIMMDEHATQATVEFDHCSDNSKRLLGVYDMAEFASGDERRLLAVGLPMVVDDTTASTRSAESVRNFSALNIGSVLNAPSSGDQRLRFMLCATKQLPHTWREDEIDLMRALANILRLKLDRAAAETALRMSEARFRDLADNISQFAWMTDATGSMLWYNQRWFDYTGTTLDQMKDLGWQAAQHPHHLNRVISHWRECRASGEVWEDTFPLRSKDGEYRWFLSRAQPIRDDAGNIVRWFGTNTDITETRQAEEQLAGSRERLTMAMTSARMGSYEWEPESNRVLWDEQHLAITGLQRPEMTGSDFLALIHPDDVESNRLAIERTINGECDYDTEFRIIRPDGQVRWLAARGKIVSATDDRPLRFVGMNWDITEQKKIDEVVRRGEARLQRIIDGASVGVAFAKTSGEVSRANDATLKILGIERSDFERDGFNWTSRVRMQQRPAAEAIIQQLLLTGRMDPCEMTIVQKNNIATPVLISSLSVDAETAEHVVFLVDLTQQKMYEQSLHQARSLAETANQSKSEFVANMSHEIRTPMTAVLGFADLLAADEDNPQKLLYLQTIKRNGGFLLDIINDILDLSKIEAGKMEILTERFPIQSVISDVRTMMEARAKEKGLNFVVEYLEKIPAEIESDPKRLRQILVNLIGNAVKFTESGHVRLVVRFIEHDGGQIQFDVTDTGIGITAEQQQRLFQPFSQGDASVTRSFGGTGLGLSISRRLARFLGGDIVLRSEPGAGSTFSFAIAVGDIFGVQRIDATTFIEHKRKAKVTDYRLNCHVLIVDDRRDVRFLSRRLLTKAGATVTEAEDGLEAIEFVKGSTPSTVEFDLVLLDMQMPRMDGYQTATILRQIGFSKPIIALTADAMYGDMKHCLECGCDDYLSKPIDADALLEMVFNHTQVRSIIDRKERCRIESFGQIQE